jgi:ABC-type phosphate transport system substrate-binding protein
LAAVVTMLAASGAASASVGQQCSGVAVTGQGANAAQIAIQSVWGPDFNTSANSTACNGTQGSGGKPLVSFTKSSSGIGLESWGANGHSASFAPSNAYVATEEPPNATQKTEIESHETKSTANTLETIPLAQEDFVILVNLPTGCTATSTSNPGRLVLNNTTLEAIWRGTITTWSSITEGGDKLSGASCNAATPITRIVRLDSAGTTHVLKKYLFLINESTFETEKGQDLTWNGVAEGTENTTWPKLAAVVRPSSTGDTAEVAKVAATPSSIGYAGLADARANTSFVPPSGGPSTALFWTPIENNGTTAKKPTYKDPSTDGESATTAQANCAKTKYTNGKSKFPPKKTTESWSPVTTATKETNYPICGIIYGLALDGYADYPGTEPAEATTVNNFFLFALSTTAEGGQSLILNHDYEPLTTPLDKEATTGAKAIE